LANPSNGDGKKPLIVCDRNKCTSIESGTKDQIQDSERKPLVEGIVHTYFIDGAYPFGNQIITCTQSVLKDTGEVTEAGSCLSNSPDNVSYYVNSGVDGNIISCGEIKRSLGYGDFPVCNEVTSDNKCQVGGVDIKDETYCVKEGLIYISHNLPSTECQIINTCESITSSFGLYATGGDVENEKLIVCDGEGRISCHYVKNLDDENGCVDVNDRTKPSNEGVIFIDESIGFMQCHEGKGEALNRNQNGYMLFDAATASKFLHGVTEPILIENNGVKSMVASDIQNGYYINIGFDMITKPVIRCTEIFGCEAIDIDFVHCEGSKFKIKKNIIKK